MRDGGRSAGVHRVLRSPRDGLDPVTSPLVQPRVHTSRTDMAVDRRRMGPEFIDYLSLKKASKVEPLVAFTVTW